MNAKIQSVASIPVNYANIHWFESDFDGFSNLRVDSLGNPVADIDFKIETDDSGDEKVVTKAKGGERGLVYALWGGWDTTQGAVSAVKATKDQAKAAVEERRKIIATYKQSENTLAFAIALEEVWFPGGKPADVEWIGNNCYRRSRGLRGVMAKRYILAIESKDKQWVHEYVVPVVPKDFGTGQQGQLNKLIDHTAENTGKTFGRKELSPLDYFKIAVEYVAIMGDAAKETDLMTKFHIKRGEAQRAFALASINRKYPELRLLERATPKPKAEGEEAGVWLRFKGPIDVRALRHADLLPFKSGKKDGKPLSGGRRGIIEATENYIETSMKGGPPAGITMGKLKDALRDSTVYMLQLLGERLTTTPTDVCGLFNGYADEINKALAKVLKDEKEYVAHVKEQEGQPEAEAA